jgi:protein tyrosine phosphatase (PTP) superfamily phosphohydrolase (DUF442 family)
MRRMVGAVAVASVWVAVWAAGAAEPATNRPAAWAQPVAVEGVPNLHKVNDTLYRSAQPTAEGMKRLEQMGIKTVLNLRTFHDDGEKSAGTGVHAERIEMMSWHPEREDAVRFLRLVTDPARAPVLVHCQHGADRTGTMCAVYRIAVQGWSKEDAIREMTEGGYGFHAVWQNLPAWIERLDVPALRKEAGLQEPATTGGSGGGGLIAPALPGPAKPAKRVLDGGGAG